VLIRHRGGALEVEAGSREERGSMLVVREECVRCLALSLIFGVGCFSSGDQNVSHPTLADWKDRLTLHADVQRAEDGSVQAWVYLRPLFDSEVSDECPHFDMRATINGEPVEVERTLSIWRSYRVVCHLPSMEAVLDPALLLERQQTRFPEPGFDTDVIQRLDVELTDESGSYAFKFGRDLPPWIEGRLVRESAGALQAGERVELVFEPAPLTTVTAYLHKGGEQYWWLFPPDDVPTSPTLGVQFGEVAGFEQTASGYAFELPALDPEATELSVGVWPWSEAFACPFADCDLGGDFMPFSTPVSVTVQLPIED
jgi:hypothetical protein